MVSLIQIRPGAERRLIVVLPYTPERVEKIRTVPGRQWDKEKKHWTVPADEGMVERLMTLFGGEEVELDPALHRDWDTIRRILAAVENELTLRRYSPKTHEAYLGHLRRFLNHFGQAAETLTNDELREYFLRPEILTDLPRPMRAKKRLPAVLSRSEVRRLFQAVDNLKHRAVLLVIYAGGLRVSEAARLKVADVDGERRRVFVRDGKGGKDRYTIIGEVALEALRDYWRVYQPSDWLFPGNPPIDTSRRAPSS